MHKSGKTEGLR